MRSSFRTTIQATALLAALAVPASAQGPTLVADMVKDLSEVEEKIVALAKAMPEAAYAWKAGQARSTGEVLQHVAADNYFLATPFGATAPAMTGISPTDYKTVLAYETRKAARAEIIADLEKSFAWLKQAISGITQAQLGESVSMFGQTRSKQAVLILTVTHLHEHLGQLIAYARANNIVPPWSR